MTVTCMSTCVLCGAGMKEQVGLLRQCCPRQVGTAVTSLPKLLIGISSRGHVITLALTGCAPTHTHTHTQTHTHTHAHTHTHTHTHTHRHTHTHARMSYKAYTTLKHLLSMHSHTETMFKYI